MEKVNLTQKFSLFEEEVHLLLLESKTTLNTRNVQNERTVKKLELV